MERRPGSPSNTSPSVDPLLLSWCISNLLLSDKWPQNLILNNKCVLSHSFCGPGIWAWLSWVTPAQCLSHKAAKWQCSSQALLSWSLVLGNQPASGPGWLLVRHINLQPRGSLHSINYNIPACFPLGKSSGRAERYRLGKQERGHSFITKSWKWHSTTFVMCYWLEASHQVQLRLRGGDSIRL